MLREEAEHEAARRNLEEPERERFEFYAFDESAGLADDAWEVGARLRDARAPIAPAPPPEEPAVPEPESDAVFAPPAPVEPKPPRRPRVPPLRRPRRRARAAAGEPPVDESARVDRGGRFMRGLGAVVIVVGMLWMAMVVALAAILSPDDAQELALYIGFGVLGLLAILVGVAIRRS
jgi:hypothetical protein